ncbi:DUF1840 domain-containing protein [Dechloromonas denitrificans]|uniref:DUF1840 domain-containing protein n=1 Tax=Dechloromonas denitrificans TaxID=281362 RepID=UPI0008319BD7|nr:DUF1840 domain-containing protein [Dechloromonas denitrificans]
MLVTFESSETSEVLMFAETAKMLLEAIGKETTKRGTFTQAEMQPAADALRQAVQRSEEAAPPVDEDEEEELKKKKEPVIVLRQRAWPLIDMLERTARSGPDAHIVWSAAADF